MEILPLGHASFKLRGKGATLVTDPYDFASVGLKFPKNIEADIVTVSHDHSDHSVVGAVGGSPYIVSGPGEYEIKGVSVIGIATFHDDEKGKIRGKNTIYRIEMDGVNIAHLGDIGHTLTSDQLEQLDGVDILLVPVGGHFTIDPSTAEQIIADVEPRVVIPMHYKTPAHSEMFKDVLGLSVFLKAMNKEEITPVAKLTVSRDKLPAEMQIVVLE